jgi:hypothetical protein
MSPVPTIANLPATPQRKQIPEAAQFAAQDAPVMPPLKGIVSSNKKQKCATKTNASVSAISVMNSSDPTNF